MTHATIADAITASILEKLEAGVKPWVRPWRSAPITRPLRHCGAAYRGINTLILWMAAEAKGYASPYWMTFNQAKILKGQVRKGEKASIAVFYKQIGAGDQANDEDQDRGGDSGTTRRVLKHFWVFNADQIEGLPDHYQPAAPPLPLASYEHEQRISGFFDRVGATVHHRGCDAYYDRRRDEIVLPPVTSFDDYPAYAATRAHETAHWTGAEHRLNRSFGKRFGDQAYAFEELCAEIAAAIVGATLGLPEAQLDGHSSYLDHWITILKADRNAILTAASKGDEAADYIIGQGQAGASRVVERPRIAVAV